MIIARTAANLAQELDATRYRGGARRFVGLVTMGGDFHDGHGAVMNAAKTVSDIVVVAIVPQPNRDNSNVVSASEFQDIAFLENHHVDVLYAPGDTEMFPQGFDAMFNVEQPVSFDDYGIGAYRLTQHLKILHAVQPDVMVWGEKKFVEFHCVRALIRDLNVRTRVQCVPTVRHADGVAVCSAVEALAGAAREKLTILYETLNNVAHAIRTGAGNFEKLEKTARLALRGAGLDIDYFRILDEQNLATANDKTTTYRIVGSVKLDGRSVTDSLGLTL
jgi:pantoate--beta-alanine ligase